MASRASTRSKDGRDRTRKSGEVFVYISLLVNILNGIYPAGPTGGRLHGIFRRRLLATGRAPRPRSATIGRALRRRLLTTRSGLYDPTSIWTRRSFRTWTLTFRPHYAAAFRGASQYLARSFCAQVLRAVNHAFGEIGDAPDRLDPTPPDFAAEASVSPGAGGPPSPSWRALVPRRSCSGDGD